MNVSYIESDTVEIALEQQRIRTASDTMHKIQFAILAMKKKKRNDGQKRSYRVLNNSAIKQLNNK